MIYSKIIYGNYFIQLFFIVWADFFPLFRGRLFAGDKVYNEREVLYLKL